jgi:hypothetical protein
VTVEVLETMIAETMALVPLPFRAAHEEINGRKNAMDIIIATAESRNNKV